MQNDDLKFKTLFCLFLLFTFYFFLSDSADAARIFFEPAESTHSVDDLFSIDVRVDTQGENINAVDLGITFPPLLEVRGISKNASIIQLWVQDPSFNSNTIFLSGGLPGGINTSNGLVAKINLRAKAVGDGGLGLNSSSSVLLNDGEGTKTLLSINSPVFHLIPKSKEGKPREQGVSSVTPSPTEKTLPSDKTRPNKFDISVGSDPRVFNSKYFASFFTTDNQSGIDHYEIKEGNGPYKIAKSPYLLEDQKLRSVIRVRAYDSAGNYREEVYPGFIKRIWWGILKVFGFL